MIAMYTMLHDEVSAYLSYVYMSGSYFVEMVLVSVLAVSFHISERF